MSIAFLVALPPAVLFAGALLCFVTPGQRPRLSQVFGEIAAFLAFISATALGVYLAIHGALSFQLFQYAFMRLAFRIDVLSVAMAVLVSFVGWIVVRYAASYLDGENRQGSFTAWLLMTLGSVMLLVLAGDLSQLVISWIATSLCIHKLLLFYVDRPTARKAARKKFIVARASDVALLGGALLLGRAYGTGDIASILDAARQTLGGASACWAAGLLAVAAALKSAQFPAHGWLTEVMETPTPVSALLHAGVVNAGGFLLIRFADVLVLSPGTLAALAIVGGFTALYGSVVMLTQPAVKTSLAWSTVAQMGFMIMECGLGLFPLALLHIIAHSLYKAHSFLACGGAVERIVASRRLGGVAIPDAGAVTKGFVVALAIYGAVGVFFGFLHKPPQAVALGAILIFGVAYLFAQGFADLAPRPLALRTTLYAVATSMSYFILQSIASSLTGNALPSPPAPGPLQWVLIGIAVISFVLVAVLQSLLPLWANHPAVAGLRVHISNGFYLNALFDRAIGGWNVRSRI